MTSIDRFMRTPQRNVAANARTTLTPTEDLHDKTSGTKKQNHSKINCSENINVFYTRLFNILCNIGK